MNGWNSWPEPIFRVNLMIAAGPMPRMTGKDRPSGAPGIPAFRSIPLSQL